MTLPDDPGYAAYQTHLSAEGVTFTDHPTHPDTVSSGALPDTRILKRLQERVTTELNASESGRRTHMERVTEAWLAHDMTPYSDDQLILPEMENMRVPLVYSRVAQAHGSLYGALAVRPFFKADTLEGMDGTVALHAEAAMDEVLERAELENALDGALRGSLVGTCGFFKHAINPDDENPGELRLDIESVDIRELYLSPHEVRNLEQCNLIAHRYNTETYGWLLDNALDGVFDLKAVKGLAGQAASTDLMDGGGTERLQLGMEGTRTALTDDGRQVDLVEAYIRFRPQDDAPREWWRVYLEYTSKTILRAEPYPDGPPFTALRHQRGQTTMYAPSFGNILRDMQWASDMLMSSSIEADKAGVAPIWKVNVLTPAWEWLKKRREENGDRAARPLPGDTIPTRNSETDIVAFQHTPTPPQVDARLNRIEQYANLSTITVQPMTTYRSATEHRYAMANVSAKEAQMLKVLRADLMRLGEKLKRLYWKYLAKPIGEDVSQIVHGVVAYETTAQQWNMLRFTPRGMTTAADQMLTMQATQEALALTMQVMPQKPMMEQAGIWPNVWRALDARLETLGIQDRVAYIGENPVKDPRLTFLDPLMQQQQMQASMALMQMGGAQGGMGMTAPGMNPGALPGPGGEVTRGSDGAPTVPPMQNGMVN